LLAYIIQRLGQSVVALFAMSVLVFLAVFAIGDPAYLLVDPQASNEQVEAIRKVLGLDRPLWQQYWIFVTRALQGDLGQSFIFGIDAIDLIFLRMPATLELVGLAVILSIGIGIPAGVYAGLHPDSTLGRTIMTWSILGFSVPTFWIGMVMIMFFAVELQWLPSTGRGDTVEILGIKWSLFTWDGLRHMFLPAVTLSLFKMSLMIRLARAGVREILMTDYVKFARAKGLMERRVIGVYVLKNIMIPIVTVMGLELGQLVTGSVITETVFAWPGMGKLIIDSIYTLDRPVMVAFLMIVVTGFIFINLVVDILYSVLDPRVRLGGRVN
jgi:peptide/nickel transport system permease protein